MKKIIIIFVGSVISLSTSFAQMNEAQKLDAKLNLVKHSILCATLLGESTGFAIIYDTNGDGKPTDLKYSPQTRQIYLAKAASYYNEFLKSYTILVPTLSAELKGDLQLIDESLSKIAKDSDYKKLIGKPTLTIAEIWSTIQFVEVLKTKVDKSVSKIICN